jgi:hypothetical protein
MMLCSIQIYGQDKDVVQISLSVYDNLKAKKITDSMSIQTQKNKIEELEAKAKDFEKEKEAYAKDSKKKEEEITKLKSDIAKLEKSDLKVELEKLSGDLAKRNSEVTENKKLIRELEVKIAESKAEFERNLVAKKEEGIQSIKNQLLVFYDKPFDQLVEVTSKGSIQRDIALLGVDSKVHEKLMNLQIYHESELLLTEKFNLAKVQKVLEQLNAMEQTEAVKKSIELLSNYELRFEGLQETLTNIIQLNSKRIGFDNPEFTKIKYGEMINELTTYFYDYEIKLNEYPYLAEVITEIIQKKQVEIDADLSYLKERLN